MRSSSFCLAIGMGLLLGLSVCAPDAAAIQWTAGTGDFNQDSNWSSGNVPSTGDEALINNGGTAQFGADFADMQALRIGLNGGSGRFEQTDGFFGAVGAFIGDNSTGSARISGGEFAIGGDSIHVGWRAGGVGTLTIDGAEAVVTSGDDFQLGREGQGSLDFSAGLLRAGYTVIGKFGTGLWNQSGGMFDQDFGDLEIGDGGTPDQSGTPGPRAGILNLSGGFIQTAGHLAIGNRRGTGTVNLSGGVFAATGGSDNSIYIGRGYQSNPGTGAATVLRVVGDDSTMVANGSLLMNPDEVAQSSTLVAQITGPTHSTIKVSGDADIRNGGLKVELNGYTPTPDDSWVLIEAGVDLADDLAAIDAQVDGAGYEPMIHGQAAFLGQVLGPFMQTDLAALPPGLSWEVAYPSPDVVVLRVTGTAVPIGDHNKNGQLDAGDLDLQTAAMVGGQNPAAYDLNNDKLVNFNDRLVWLHDLKKTWVGDSDLNGLFESADFVVAFQSGKYEVPGANATWVQGDWNGDLTFTSADFVAAFADGGYEAGARPGAVSAVPEPGSIVMALVGLLGLAGLARRR